MTETVRFFSFTPVVSDLTEMEGFIYQYCSPPPGHDQAILALMSSIHSWLNSCIRLLPLGGKDAVEDSALPAVTHGFQDKHVLDDIEGKAVIRERTQELGFQEGRPFLLQNPLTAFIPLQTVQAQFTAASYRSAYAMHLY